MGLIMVWVYSCTEMFRAVLIESVVIVSLNRAIFEQVLGGVGATVDLRNVLDCLILDFRFNGFGLP